MFRLPREILLEIGEKLGDGDVAKLIQTCKSMQTILGVILEKKWKMFFPTLSIVVREEAALIDFYKNQNLTVSLRKVSQIILPNNANDIHCVKNDDSCYVSYRKMGEYFIFHLDIRKRLLQEIYKTYYYIKLLTATKNAIYVGGPQGLQKLDLTVPTSRLESVVLNGDVADVIQFGISKLFCATTNIERLYVCANNDKRTTCYIINLAENNKIEKKVKLLYRSYKKIEATGENILIVANENENFIVLAKVYENSNCARERIIHARNFKKICEIIYFNEEKTLIYGLAPNLRCVVERPWSPEIWDVEEAPKNTNKRKLKEKSW